MTNNRSDPSGRYRASPAVVDAWQLTEESWESKMPDWLVEAYKEHRAWNHDPAEKNIAIVTSSGTAIITLGGWIICDDGALVDPKIAALDEAWKRIMAERANVRKTDINDELAILHGLNAALAIIESLGGMDPTKRSSGVR